MSEFLEILCIVLWIIYILIAIYDEINKSKEKRKLFDIVKLDNIFFLVVYLLYNHYVREEVLMYLYLIILIRLMVYLLYDVIDSKNTSLFKGIRNNRVYYLLGVILCIFVIIYYVYTIIYKVLILTLIINLILPIFICLIKYLKKD